MSKKLIIFGTGNYARMTYWYFTEDSEYEVVAYCANKEFITEKDIHGLPLVAFENIEEKYPPEDYQMFVAAGYKGLNEMRKSMFVQAKNKGYKLASYVHSGIKLWFNNKIGENTFIFENNTIQLEVEIGDNVVVWSGNHFGHGAVVKNHCWITTNVVIYSDVVIEDHCFLGSSTNIRDGITVSDHCFVGAGTNIWKSTKPKDVFLVEPTKAHKLKSDQLNF